MTQKLIKIALVILMVVGVCFSAFNFFAVKVEAKTLWQDLKLGTDPILGTPSVTCLKTGQACITVIESN
jgi:hypothetical protein